MLQTGLDRLLNDRAISSRLRGKRLGLLAHPASVDAALVHAVDALAAHPELELSALFGPQHGIKGELQDNMMESEDFVHPQLGIPVFSLYGENRRPTAAMMAQLDVLLVDLQDLGCRIYTFVTTLLYVLEAAAEHGKTVWVLDRPNPAGRPVEGMCLVPGNESFVGAGPMPMRHGLTMGEMADWFVRHFCVDVDFEVVEMVSWEPDQAPGFGWPLGQRAWLNPSPNAQSLNMARVYAGTVMLEGTHLSEGRGTTRALECFGAPDMDASAVLARMYRLAPEWLTGCRLRECWFEPTFHKHVGQLCHGVFIHADDAAYDHGRFRPWRVQALAFKAIAQLWPDYPLWRDFPYEYEFERLAIDVINGSSLLREWVDDATTLPGDLDALARRDEAAWGAEIAPYLRY